MQFLRDLLWLARQLSGGKHTFGFDPDEIGTKSIRSGAAMSLFLMDHQPHKIMMIRDMIRFDSFTDLARTFDSIPL